MRRSLSDFDMDADFLFESLCASSRDYFFVWNYEKNLVAVSPSTAKDFGMPDMFLETDRENWIRFVHERDVKRVRETVAEAFAGCSTRLSLECQLLTASGKYIWVAVQAIIKREVQTDRPILISGLVHNLINEGGIDIYRFDGDQFIIMGDYVTKEGMMDLYWKLQSYTSQLDEINGQTYRLTASAGLIAFPDQAFTWSELEKGASIALKKTKENGKNQCVEFSHEMLQEKFYEQTLSRYLADSVENGFEGFWVVFQPVCEAYSLKVKGAEILLRYKTPAGDQMSPLEFIPLLEASHLIIPVGIWVLEQAIITCKEWIMHMPDFVMNVNVSYLQLRDPDFCEKVELLLKKYNLDTKHLILELTESYFITDAQNINDSLNRFQDMRLQLAMDDFGTGYSSLARLAQFNVDIVKIDKTFVQSLHKSQYNHDFVESVVRLCHNVGMKVCVEGVETREEQSSVNLLNVDYIQGFYVSEPVVRDMFFDTFIHSPYDNERLIVAIDSEVRQKRLVNDKDLALAMIKSLPLCLNLWSRDQTILACNDELLHLLGAKNFSDIKENFFDFSPIYQPDGVSSEKKLQEKLLGAFESSQDSFFWVHCTREGELIPTEVNFVKVPYQDDFIIAGYIRDMRVQKAIEEKNMLFQRRLKALLDATPLCFNLWNRDMDNIMCNQEAVKLFGLNDEKEYMEQFFRLSPKYQPDGQLSTEKAKAEIEKAFSVGRTQFSWMHCTFGGEMIPAEITLVKLEGEDNDGQDLVAGYTRDIRSQLKVEAVERRAARRIKGVIDSTPLACLLWNIDEKIIDCNKMAAEMFEAVDKKDLLEHFTDFLPRYQPDGSVTLDKMKEKFQEVRLSGHCIFEWMYQNRRYEAVPCEVCLVKVILEEEEIIVAYSRDLRELRQTLELNAKLTQIANHDTLTGCASRASFMELLSLRFANTPKDGLFALLFFDFDNFKQINDQYGHDAGDMTLRSIVQKVSSLLPTSNVVGRFGGDEFMIQLWEKDFQEISDLLEMISSSIYSEPLLYGEHSFRISLSIGATFRQEGDGSCEDMIKRADDALYEAKRNGRNCGVIV